MEASEPAGGVDVPPDPGQARTLGDLIERLRALKSWAGNPSYETIKNRINATWRAAGRPASELTSKTTVIDCFRPGRRRLNTDLVVAVVETLHPDVGYVAQWRQALRVVGGEVPAGAQVRGQDTLPTDLVEFTGRDAELDRLRQIFGRRVVGGRVGGGDPVVISAIEGMAGVGKTRLAIHAGHVLGRAEPFERTLFVNLRGFHHDPTQPPADPAAVLDSFLRLLGVPGQEVPHDLPARTALYRRRLAGVRALVVLDDAADEAQVRPLLPESPHCVTLITSRRSLAALPRAVRLPVAVFTPTEALDFLARVAGDRPVGPDPDAAARLAHRCGYLPLALGLVAGLIRAKPDWTLTDHADWLDERRDARKLEDGVELALSLSYGGLPAARQRLFRLLALHPGQDVDAYAAAALADLGVDAAADHLHRLVADHLLVQAAPGRFVFHDLVRAYAAGLAGDEDRPPDRRAALTRLFDYYLYTAAAAMDVFYPAERHLRPRVAEPATPAPAVAEPAAARSWLETERVNLIAAAGHAATRDWPGHTTRLAATVFRYLDVRGFCGDAVTLHTHARHAARRTDDRVAEAHALTNLGTAHWRQSAYQPAADHYRAALALFREVGDRPGEARALTNLSAIHCSQGRYEPAGTDAQCALEIYDELGDGVGAARVLATLGLVHWHLGRYPQAIEHHQRALTLNRELGEPGGEAVALNGLGLVYEKQGRYEEAVRYQREALAVYRKLGHRSGEAYALADLGVIDLRLGRPGPAAEHLGQALTRFRDLGDTAGETNALNGLGEALVADGRSDEARDRFAKAHDLAVEIGDRYEQARALDGIAGTHQATGETDEARRYWRDALTIYTELGVPEADDVRGHLTRVEGGT